MNPSHSNRHDSMTRYRPTLSTMLVISVGATCFGAAAIDTGNPCNQTAGLMLKSAKEGARAAYLEALAKASTISDPDERHEAEAEAREEFGDELELADDQYDARVDLCELLDEDRYDPEIDPDHFLSPEEIAANPNPFLPLVPGTTYWYESQTDEGVETIRVYVSHETKEILGVDCIVVEDTVWLDGKLLEDTRDWETQDVDGNVWYFGEITLNYEDGELVDIEGSWKAGEDGAKPGIIMLAEPKEGVAYRQEMLLGSAEDAGEILSLDEEVTVPYGTFDHCIMTGDFTPIEPDGYEHKYYAEGIGFVLEFKPKTGERVELIDIEYE